MRRFESWARVVAILALLAMATVVAACGTATSPTVAVSRQSTVSTQKPTPTASGPVIAHVGDTLVTDAGLQCTLVKVTVLQPGQYDSVKSGDVYIVATVTLKNTGSGEADYNELNFHIKTSSGNITDTTYTMSYTANNGLNSGKLAAGGTVTGDLVFESPQGDHGEMLTWQPNFFGNAGDSGWLLGL